MSCQLTLNITSMFTCVLFYSADLCSNHDLVLWCLFSKVTSLRKNQMQLIEEAGQLSLAFEIMSFYCLP